MIDIQLIFFSDTLIKKMIIYKDFKSNKFYREGVGSEQIERNPGQRKREDSIR